jgi:hypothetical protein
VRLGEFPPEDLEVNGSCLSVVSSVDVERFQPLKPQEGRVRAPLGDSIEALYPIAVPFPAFSEVGEMVCPRRKVERKGSRRKGIFGKGWHGEGSRELGRKGLYPSSDFITDHQPDVDAGVLGDHSGLYGGTSFGEPLGG